MKDFKETIGIILFILGLIIAIGGTTYGCYLVSPVLVAIEGGIMISIVGYVLMQYNDD